MATDQEAPAMATDQEAPLSMEVPKDSVGMIIGRAGTTIKRLKESTGCAIEIDKEETKEGTVLIRLEGDYAPRALAAAAISDLLQAHRKEISGKDAIEDHAARAEGALVLPHGLEENFLHRSWLGWRLISLEHLHRLKADMGRRCVRLWARDGELLPKEAKAAKASVNEILEEARGLTELTVHVPLQNGPDGQGPEEHALDAVNFDPAIYPLVDQHGVLVNVPRVPEDGRMPVKVVGREDPAQAAARMVEARYGKGHSVSSVLQYPGQVQAMEPTMSKDFQNDVAQLEARFQCKVFQTETVLWIQAGSSEVAGDARQMLQEMMQYYLPEGFMALAKLELTAVDRMQADGELRWLRSQPNAALAFSRREGNAWLCGDQISIQAMRSRIEAILGRWSSEHWEMELDNYGDAMWLLGPKGTGEYIGRIQAESGCRVSCCPNKCRVWADGPAINVQEAKRLVIEAMEQLNRKRKENPEEELERKRRRTERDQERSDREPGGEPPRSDPRNVD